MGRRLAGCEAGCLGEIGGGIGKDLLGCWRSGWDEMKEEEGCWMSVEEKRELGALRALDALALSGRPKAEEGGVELRILSSWGGVERGLDSNPHRREQQLLAAKDG